VRRERREEPLLAPKFDAASGVLISRRSNGGEYGFQGSKPKKAELPASGDFACASFHFLSFAKPGAAQLGDKPEKSNLTISYTQASGAFTPLWVAQEAGLFKKYGLDATSEHAEGARCRT
jgi:hypothetical protein